MHHASHGVLSTHSLEVPGYPFGSIMPYCLDLQGMPIILIANIALHTKNICSDNKVSLTISETGEGNVQEFGRLTILGNCDQVDDTDTYSATRYATRFPDSASYFKVHSFQYYRINIVKVRYIGGFGKIHWLEPGDFVLPNPLSAESESRIVAHMNKDHKDELVNYCYHYKKLKAKEPQMVGIDSEGFDLLEANNLIRFTFPKQIETLLEAKEMLVGMAQESKLSKRKTT